MRGKTVIVTGGSSGMGKAMVGRFCQEGANVVICARNEERMQEVKKEYETFPGQVLTFVLDVREEEKVKEMVETVHETFGSIDHLVNNAAGNFVVPAEKLSNNGWRSVIDIVLNGTWYCTNTVGNYWIEKGIKGSIVNIVATYAWTGAAGVVHSASAKAGVLAMTQTLAVEWGSKYGIRLNAIAPGPIERTGGTDKLIQDEKAYKMVQRQVPLKRFGTPEEIASVTKFLLSEEAAFINGDCITVDGGHWLSGFRFL
ncbi:NAD(P)-dependent dehydrogenase (short-subunit alcohol dehydrogenase family) [Croceifilum oryzae]|uniref:NAD(P)-dependent dehydrogenase (Short-subunit alcohol dehydrogenase family) n=1 Tax=Croceifilum oryzae TaxID=1553429 RepID=A0AAJ1TEK5_9BACL|nr:2,4-dienoyl-CoA reductase [Croceifilum oryzae]MDQ0417438.1 NAD(P)-dependent dehydrogenase (short-subunit alcohol dehydrogenase family) [Croceifilum oryzae]